jgi:hypothetical protein
MSSRPVTLDMSTSVPVKPVTLDMSTSIPLNKASAEDQASQTRQMLVSGLTGMPTPNMTADDRASFERGKAAGAVSVPAVAGAVATPAVLSAGVNALLPAVTRGVVGVTEWAAQHPVASKMIWEALKAGLTGTAAGAGARFAGKIINASGE